MRYEEAMHKKSELSAEGAEYDSQGQAPNNVRRVAPGDRKYLKRALKVRNIDVNIPLFQSSTATLLFYQGRCASRCSPLAPGCHIARLRRSDFLSQANKEASNARVYQVDV